MSFLAVRIRDGYADRVITQHVTGLQFTDLAPGGFARARMRITLPRTAFPDLGPADRIWITDPRTGETVWEGFCENPGREDGPEGQGWALTAAGSMVVAYDTEKPVIYVDSDLQAWEPDNLSSVPAFATAQITADPNGTGLDGILVGFQSGQNVLLAQTASMAYARLTEAGQGFAAIQVTGRSGKDDTGYRVQLYTTAIGVADDRVLFSDAGMINEWRLNTRLIGTASGPPVGVHRVALRLIRTTGSGNIADDNTWAFITRISVVGRRMNKYGVLATGPDDIVSASFVHAHWVVADAVARFMPSIDPDHTVIEAPANPYPIDQLAWPEAVRAGDQILPALETWHPEMTWEVRESRPDRGFAFNYRSIPAAVRYELSAPRDQWQAPGSPDDLCNLVTVTWRDERGNLRTRQVTSEVPSLTAAKRLHAAPGIRLPDGQGSIANAQRAGEEALRAKSTPPVDGRAVVSRPIRDLHTGQWIQPWEIRAGYLASVREENIVLPITERTYDDDSGAAQLTLGKPMLTETQQLARLVRASR